MAQVIYGLAPSSEQATQAVERVRQAGFGNETIALLLHADALRTSSHETHGHADLAGIQLTPLPGVHDHLAAGPVLSGHAGHGRIGVVGLLQGNGFSARQAMRHAAQLLEGKVFVAVMADDRADVQRLTAIFKGAGMTEVATAGGWLDRMGAAVQEEDGETAGVQPSRSEVDGNPWRLSVIWTLLKEAASKWVADKVPQLGAALAYYTIFSLAPLLVIAIGLAGLVFGEEAAKGQIVEEIAGLVGEQSAETIENMVAHAQQRDSGVVATVVGVAVLLVSASFFFGQLQDSLNTIWGVEPKPGQGILGMVRERFFSFVAVLGTAFLLLVSLVLSAGLAAAGRMFGAWLPTPEVVLHLFDVGLSFLVITFLFAMIFRLLPDAKIAWSDVWLGAAVTTLLFTIGKEAIGLYLGKSELASGYGAAGSFVIILAWVYYAAQILLFGAEFTAVYANKYGSRIVPAATAQPSHAGSPAA